MASGYIAANGQDLDAVFATRDGTAARANVGYAIAGVDLAQRYRASTGGDIPSVDTGFKSGGVDLRQLFRRLGYVAAPVITSIWTNAPKYEGERVDLSVRADALGWTLQWYRPNGTPISGATSADYSFYPSSTSQSGNYSVTITNSAGSDSASIYVEIIEQIDPPVINSITSNSPRQFGQTVSLSVSASGTGPLTYQWYDAIGMPVSGATSSSYSFTASSLEQSGWYACTVTGPGGNDTASTYVVIEVGGVAPNITSTSGGGTVTVGQTASFSVTATGTTPRSYQWKKGGSNISGATSSSYSFTTTSTSDSGSYSCTVTNAYGSATSSGISLTVNAAGTPPNITSYSGGGTITVGQTASFSVTATGTAPLSYQWHAGIGPIPGATSSSFSFTTTTTGNSGTYTCVVTNAYGTDSQDFSLTVNPAGVAPTITNSSGGGAYSSGASVNLSVSASGTVPLSYQWYRNGSPISGATGSSYSFTAASGTVGSYMVVVSNAYAPPANTSLSVSLY